MAITYNIAVPITIQRLGESDVEDLIIIGLRHPITIKDIESLLEARYPNRKRAARAILRTVADSDIDKFNAEMSTVRDGGIGPQSQFTLRMSYARSICTLRTIRGG